MACYQSGRVQGHKSHLLRGYKFVFQCQIVPRQFCCHISLFSHPVDPTLVENTSWFIHRAKEKIKTQECLLFKVSESNWVVITVAQILLWSNDEAMKQPQSNNYR